ncbi:hypothetical protein [Haladaptatus sp. CMAA 1911]|uniref:hypothetical protein n=1 Tax=unclassified Haladaptatus TaxID=2622732 RepID=UPI003753F7A2
MARNQSVAHAFQSLSLLTALALAVFAFASAVMLGIATDVTTWLQSRPLFPAFVSFASLSLVFASSSTRDARNYHPAEWTVVVSSMLIMASYALVDEVGSFVQSTEPVSQVLLFLLFLACSAVIAR